MKKLLLIIVIVGLVTSCSSKTLSLESKSIVKEEVALRDVYNIYLPFALNKSVSSIRVSGVGGTNVEQLDYNFEIFNENISKKDDYYVYGLMLNIYNASSNGEFIIDELALVLDGENYYLPLDQVEMKRVSNYEQSLDYLKFIGSPVTAYDYSTPLIWEIEVLKDVKISKLLLTNSQLKIQDIELNGESIHLEQADLEFKKGSFLKMEINIQPNSKKLENFILGTDLVVEFKDQLTNKDYFIMSPIITRIYGSGDALEYYLK
ncbi:hypothetical protein [Bacillus kwashiorkori]|uniref:hypothetical protein n=1 Tax=Bacillus kwashiorkori TaxID=1522318 RepID=UPI000782BDEA|nr:hypothetical protein [Bacillus kwashiorkori]